MQMILAIYLQTLMQAEGQKLRLEFIQKDPIKV